MSKIRKILINLFFMILLSQLIYAWDWSGTQSFNCEGCCVEDKTFQYSATITNTGSERFFLDSARLKKESGSTIADWGSVDGSGYYVSSGETETVTLTGNIPAPTGSYLTYKICFYLSEQRTNWWGGTSTYSDWSCSGTDSKQITSKSNFKCFTDSNCANEEYCYISTSCTSECRGVSQGSCGHIVNHKWVNYECCSDSGCSSSENCINNFCVNIPCECGYISNNKCIKYECCENDECRSDQQCISHECKTPDCGYCSYVVNHRCTKYECCENSQCDSDEKCVEHKCQKLECKFGEYIEAHQCKKHGCMSDNDCSNDEICKNNDCVKLQCAKNQVYKYHKCKTLPFHPLSYIKNHREVSIFSQEAYQDYKPLYYVVPSIIILIIAFLIFHHNKDKIKKHKSHPKKTEHKKKSEESKEEKIKESKKKFCNKCGVPIKGNEKYCRKCGNKLR
jgi:hypothetical protein